MNGRTAKRLRREQAERRTELVGTGVGVHGVLAFWAAGEDTADKARERSRDAFLELKGLDETEQVSWLVWTASDALDVVGIFRQDAHAIPRNVDREAALHYFATLTRLLNEHGGVLVLAVPFPPVGLPAAHLYEVFAAPGAETEGAS